VSEVAQGYAEHMRSSASATAGLLLTLLLAPALAGCAPASQTRPVAAAPAAPTVHERVTQAVRASTADDEPVLLALVDGSRASDALEALLGRDRVANELQSSFHLVRIDVSRPAGRAEATSRGVRLPRSGVPTVAVLVGGQTVYAGADRAFAHPARISDREALRWLRRWS
jgi:hypothetical protein